MASTSLSRTFSSAGNRKLWTWSGWLKRCNLNAGASDTTFAGYTDADNRLRFNFLSERIEIFGKINATTVQVIPSAAFRDTSAWYHFVWVMDSAQATASDRMKIYVNGSLLTAFDTTTYPAQNAESVINNNTGHYLGQRGDGASYLDGYQAECHFIDGQALSPTDFGQTDSTGIWKPKSYSGTYGTNGFYLKFSNSGDLGADSSGNGNNFTKSGNGRQMTDAPSNVFATLNELTTSTYPELREGNLQQYNHDTANSGCAASTIMPKEGKWYCELFLESPSPGDYPFFGITDQSQLNQQGTHGTKMAAGFEIDGVTTTQSPTNLGTITLSNTNWQTFADNDIVMFCLDCDNKKWWIGRNGTWTNSGDPAAGTNQQISWTNATEVCSVMMGYSGGGGGGDQSVWNFGQDGSFAGKTTAQGNADGNGIGDFYYSPPTGFVALCTKNLATEVAPTIDDGSQYFNTLLYTGTGVNPTSRTGVGFQPDWIWAKERSSTSSHRLIDSSRGNDKVLISSDTTAELTRGDIQSFDSDGFTTDDGGAINESGQTYVAWNWLANGGTTSSNTDGSITSTVQANTTAGFSIVTYTGTGSLATVGHGLGKTPKMIIWKRRDGATNWSVQGTQSGINTDQTELNLNSTGAVSGVDSRLSRQSQWSSTTFEVNTYVDQNASGGTYVAYCFAEIEGYSKFGSYTGNGNADGTFVYTGFKPAFVIIKRTDLAKNWYIFDSVRNTFNVIDDLLAPNLNDAESSGTGTYLDVLSNGFKLRQDFSHTNASGSTQIYMAFAEHPFVTSGGLPVTAR